MMTPRSFNLVIYAGLALIIVALAAIVGYLAYDRGILLEIIRVYGMG